jgi:hypothetical protein
MMVCSSGMRAGRCSATFALRVVGGDHFQGSIQPIPIRSRSLRVLGCYTNVTFSIGMIVVRYRLARVMTYGAGNLFCIPHWWVEIPHGNLSTILILLYKNS